MARRVRRGMWPVLVVVAAIIAAVALTRDCGSRPLPARDGGGAGGVAQGATPDRVRRPAGSAAEPRAQPSPPRPVDPAVAETIAVTVVRGGSGVVEPLARVRLVRARRVYVGPLAAEAVEVTADEMGRATITVPPEWKRLRLAAESQDGRAATRGSVPCVAGDDVSLRIDECVVVMGRVTNLGATPGASVRVLAYGPDWPETPSKRAIPVAYDGTFVVRGIVSYVSLFAAAPGRVPSPRSYLRVDDGSLVLGSDNPVELSLGGEAVRVTLRVTFDDGAPLPRGARIAYEAGGTWTSTTVGADGLAVLDSVKPGEPLSVRVRSVRDVDGTCFVAVSSRVTLPVPAPGNVEPLRVPRALDAQFVASTGAGAAALSTVLERVAEAQEGSPEPPAPTSAGHFEFDERGRIRACRTVALAAGDYRLRLVDGPVLWSGRLSADTVADPVLVDTSDWVPVRVRVIDQGGAAIPASLTLVKRPSAETGRYMQTAAGVVIAVPRDVAEGRRPGGLVVSFVGFPPTTVPLEPGRSTLDVPVPADSGLLRFRFDPAAVPTRCSVEVVGDSNSSLRYHGSLQRGGDAIVVGPVVPGSYSWRTQTSSLVRDVGGEGVTVSAGLTTDVMVR